MSNTKIKIRATVLLVCVGLIAFALQINKVYSQQKKVENIIIDTDCAPDDLRAICLLASVKEVNILAVVSSDFSLDPASGASKISRLLETLGYKKMQVGTGRNSTEKAPAWREFASGIKWGELNNTRLNESNSAGIILKNALNASTEQLTYVCLGPLTNLYDLISSNADLKKKISRIIWYDSGGLGNKGGNYTRDSKAAEFVIRSGLNMDIIGNPNIQEGLSAAFISELEKINTPYAKAISAAMSSPGVAERIESGHMKFWDDLVPVYMFYPELFDMQPDKNNPAVSYMTGCRISAVKEKIIQILSRTYSLQKNIVLEKFPVDSDFYLPDVRPYAEEIYTKYGPDEWKICVLTNEIHGHLGAYSLIGAKMGVKAREILGAEIDRINVVSMAGSEPPLSCLNDGLQISTGATLGLGMISISADSLKIPSAVFSYKGRKIQLTLKETYRDQMDRDLAAGVLKYGNLTDGYWKLVRELAIKYWLGFDRNEIFTVIEIK